MSDLCADCQRGLDVSDGSDYEFDDDLRCRCCNKQNFNEAASNLSVDDDITRSIVNDEEGSSIINDLTENLKVSTIEPSVSHDGTKPSAEGPSDEVREESDIPKLRRVRAARRHLFSHSILPSGMKVRLWIPAGEKSYKKWKCGKKSQLIELNHSSYTEKQEYTIIAKEMENTKRSHASGAYSGYHIITIKKIVNQCLWNKFRLEKKNIEKEHKKSNVRLLFHGTPSWEDIAHHGFNESYSQMGGMFGAGIYFASNSSKSNQYAFGLGKGCPTHNDTNCFICVRHLLICRVALGRMKTYQTAQRLSHAPPGYNSVKGEASPVSSIFGLGLKYDEYIVYRGEQVYPEFLISYKLK